jgi:hypothetical protein
MNAETEPLPPNLRERSKATRRKSSQVSVGKLIPVVRCVRSSALGPVRRALILIMITEQVY